MAVLQAAMDHAAQVWLQWMWPMAWQAALLGIVIAGVALLSRKASPRFRYFLWCLVFLKLCLPPSLAFVTGAGQWLLPKQAAAAPAALSPSAATMVRPDAEAAASREDPAPARPLTPASAPAARAAFHISWPKALFGGWCIGVLALALLFAIQHRRMGRLLAASRPVSDEGLLRLLAEARAALGVRRKVKLVSVENLHSPILFGAFRPQIAIPRQALESLPPDQIRPILLHELAHLRRMDLWLSFVQLFVQIIYWFHPAAWLSHRQMRRERELIVDDIVLAQLDGQRESYSASLLSIVRQGAQRRLLAPAYLGIIETPGSLAQRLKRILDPNRNPSLRMGWPGLILLVALGCVLIPQTPQQKSAENAAPRANPRVAAAAAASPAPRTYARVPASTATAAASASAASSSVQLPGATDADLAVLKDRQGVRFLSISNGEVTDDGLACLTELKDLQTLRLPGCAQITDAGLAHLKDMDALSALNLSGSQMTDAGLASLAQLKSLRSLSLAHTQVTDAGLAALANFESLQTLDIADTQVSDAGLTALEGRKLHSLRIDERLITDTGLAHLKAMARLDWLDLSNSEVTDGTLARVAQLKGLSGILLRNCANIIDAGVAELKEITTLNRLDLSGTQVTDAGLESLAKLKGLRILYLTHTRITDAGVRQIKEFKHLGRLELSGTEITDAGLADLKGLKELAAVLLYKDTQLTEAGIAGLKTALPRTKVWTDADLKAASPSAPTKKM